MRLNQSFRPAPDIRPLFNIGCLLDIQTGAYHQGEHGEHILNGGMAPLTGIGARGNMGKSLFAWYHELSFLNRYVSATAGIYDTELTVSRKRQLELADQFDNLKGQDLFETGRLSLTDKNLHSGTEWWDMVKDYSKEKSEKSKDYLTTPFIDKDGKPIKIMIPELLTVDSFSQFKSDVVLKLQEGSVGESDRNVEAMRDASAKSQLLNDSTTVLGKAGLNMILTAHMGDGIQMDTYAPKQKKLTFLKGDIKFKYVPENFTFLTNNCWAIIGSSIMLNQTTKAPEFPRSSEDDMKGDTDLMALSVQNLRGKYGPTGLITEIIVSQSEGFLPGLTEFCYAKHSERFGIGGNDRNYFMELCPDINLSRTTVRSKITEHAKLRRALEINAELCMMYELWHDLDPELKCAPKDLFEDLKKKGYDWDMILGGTRGYWTFKEDKSPLQFLSTMDLLRMRVDKYKPYWL